jgi:YgiT-type zinc finger domain-containing protein
MNCEACRIGRYQATALSYLHPWGQKMIIIPNAPAYICDVCKQSYFDPYFLDTLDVLLTRLDPLGSARPVSSHQAAPSPIRNDLLPI